jgi:hypothetical protein
MHQQHADRFERPQGTRRAGAQRIVRWLGMRRPLIAHWTLIGALACGARAQTESEGAPLGSVDLSLVQAVDGQPLADGDSRAFRAADQSAGLVYGRHASGSDSAMRRGACNDDPRVLLGLVSLETCVGAELFFRESFGGNGRTCGSCHPATNNFTIDKPFIASLSNDDPLFVAERNPALAELERPELLREFGLVLENVDGLEDPTRKFVMRAVSHTFSLATSITPPPLVPPNTLTSDGTPIPPVHRTGWSGDGAPGDGALRDFARGAVEQHATRSLERVEYADFMPPTDSQLSQLEQFQMNLGRKNEIDTLEVRLADSGAERGRQSMVSGPARVCEDCHINGGANNFNIALGTVQLANSNFPVDSERIRLPILDELDIPRDGGFGRQPFDANRDGVLDSFGNGAFNSQPLIEAADTGPYFHANSAETIEDVIRFYMTDEFRNSPSGQLVTQNAGGEIPFLLTDTDVADLARFLRVINVAFNCQLALARLEGAFQISEAFGNRYVSIQRGLLELARLEIEDAQQQLEEVDELHPDVQERLRAAQRSIGRAHRTLYRKERAEKARDALLEVSAANRALGTGLEFQIGEGTLMF